LFDDRTPKHQWRTEEEFVGGQNPQTLVAYRGGVCWRLERTNISIVSRRVLLDDRTPKHQWRTEEEFVGG